MPPLKHRTHNPKRRQFIKWGLGTAAASALPFGIAFARQKTQARILILGPEQPEPPWPTV